MIRSGTSDQGRASHHSPRQWSWVWVFGDVESAERRARAVGNQKPYMPHRDHAPDKGKRMCIHLSIPVSSIIDYIGFRFNNASSRHSECPASGDTGLL